LKTTLVLVLLLTNICAFANMKYYPADFLSKIQTHTIKDETLKETINIVLTANHQKIPNAGNDTLGCNIVGAAGCYNQIVLGYNGARQK
jgi:hypothetical protein